MPPSSDVLRTQQDLIQELLSVDWLTVEQQFNALCAHSLLQSSKRRI